MCRHELLKLQAAIQQTDRVLLADISPTPPDPLPNVDPVGQPLQEPEKASRFNLNPSKLLSKLHRRKAPDEEGLLDRRRSDDSALSAATTTSDRSIQELERPHEVDDAGRLLEALAPLVSKLQQLGGQVPCEGHCSIDLGGSKEVDALFLTTCSTLQTLLEALQIAQTPSQLHLNNVSGADKELIPLMLDALIRKVEAERARLDPHLPSVLMPKSRGIEDHRPSGSPLSTTPPDNPFVYHSSSSPAPRLVVASIAPGAKRGRSIPNVQPRPIRPHVNTSFSAFASHSQSTSWAANLIRIGSFQNSFLFSQSPVAVKRPGV